MLDQITPIILTYNEAPNIGRALERLNWARDIVVVDSFSTDETLDIVSRYPQVRVFQRAFSSHAEQWNFAAFETGVTTEWLLALDADYIVPPAAVDEIRALDPSAPIDGYRVYFRYCIWGEPLRGTLYPAVTVLFRKSKGSFYQDGHTHRLRLDGVVGALDHALDHDDRKSLSHWLSAQDRYMRLEAAHVRERPWSALNFADRLRCFPPLALFVVFVYCYFFKGGMLDGRPGLYYALQRTLAEALLALRILQKDSSDR